MAKKKSPTRSAAGKRKPKAEAVGDSKAPPKGRSGARRKTAASAKSKVAAKTSPTLKAKKSDAADMNGRSKTSGSKTTAKSARAAEPAPAAVETTTKRRKIKTPLSAKQLREFKELLLEKRAQLAGDVQRLTSEALHRGEGGNDHSPMPIHMADIGSDNWEQDFTLGLIANEENVVREIDEALSRIEDRTYGVCMATGEPIGLARLEAKPWAKYCIEYARMREEGRAP